MHQQPQSKQLIRTDTQICSTTGVITYHNSTALEGTMHVNRGGRELDMVYLYDSNFNYININRLWSTRNSLKRSCPDLNALEDFIDESNITSLKSILIHTGVNDTDDTCGTKVGEKLFTIINKIQAKFPGIKIIVSEVTPRMDGKDSEVKKCNNVINQYAKRREGIYIAAHSNLRDQRFFRDSKHIKEIKIAKFATNLKLLKLHHPQIKSTLLVHL